MKYNNKLLTYLLIFNNYILRTLSLLIDYGFCGLYFIPGVISSLHENYSQNNSPPDPTLTSPRINHNLATHGSIFRRIRAYNNTSHF
jgi:hypothetical protein